MNITLTIQENLKDLRVKRKLTLEQLAEQTGLSKSALGKYENDDFKDISPFAIMALAKFYGVTTDYLLKGIEPAPPVRDKRADGRIFTIVASVLNLIGVLVACVVFYETQMAGAIVIGLVFLALGCMVFGIGMVESAPDSKPRAKRDFWLVNIWLLAFMPWSFVWNVIYTFPGAPYPLGGCLGVFWVVYLLGCTAVALLQIKKARAEKGGG